MHDQPTECAHYDAADPALDPDQEVLRRHQARLLHRSQAFLTAADPLLIHDLDGCITDLNIATERVFGWSRDALLGASMRTLLDPESGERHDEALARCRSGGTPVELETVLRTASGEQVPVRIRMSVVAEESGTPAAVVLATQDLREARRLDRLRAAAVRDSQRAEERERQNIAGELHDSLAQLIALARIHVVTIRDQDPSVAPDQRLRQLEELLDEADRRTRTLMFRLTPGDLGEHGIAEPLRDMCADVAERYEQEITFEDASGGGGAQPLDGDVATTLFRAVRELLINAARHAGTSLTAVRLLASASPDTLEVEVADDGKGFEWRRDAPRGFGLYRVAERVESLGGQIDVASAPGHGARIRLTVPRRVDPDLAHGEAGP